MPSGVARQGPPTPTLTVSKWCMTQCVKPLRHSVTSITKSFKWSVVIGRAGHLVLLVAKCLSVSRTPSYQAPPQLRQARKQDAASVYGPRAHRYAMSKQCVSEWLGPAWQSRHCCMSRTMSSAAVHKGQSQQAGSIDSRNRFDSPVTYHVPTLVQEGHSEPALEPRSSKCSCRCRV